MTNSIETQKNGLPREELLEQLTRRGLVFKSFSLDTVGNYTVEDAIWNYKDALAHLPFLHPQVSNLPVVVQPGLLVSIFLQKLFIFKIPITVVDMLLDPHTQTTFTNCFLFTLIVRNECRALGPSRAQVTTTYSVGFPRFLSWLFPLIKRLLAKNYDKLMSTDIPCRERRGELRNWGYTFDSDSHSFLEAQNIFRNNVIPPPQPSPVCYSINLEKDFKLNSEFLAGRSDSNGLRITKEAHVYKIFPRLCPHEGASMDKACKKLNSTLECPWHGRPLKPLFTLDTNQIPSEGGRSGRFEYTLNENVLMITVHPQERPTYIPPIETPLSSKELQ